MKTRWVRITACLALLFALTLSHGVVGVAPLQPDVALAKEKEEKSKKEGLRVDDLPKPIPAFMKSIQRVGNSVGKAVTRASSEGASAVKKLVTEDEKDQKEKP